MYRKLKPLYWPEQTFNFLGLPPEIRMNVYRYTLPTDGIYYLTARKMRTYDRRLQEVLNNEIVHPPPSLLRVCRLVYKELWSIIYKKCVFYITIYSIRDLLYTLDLFDRYTNTTTPHSTDIFYHMKNIRIRINDLILDIHPLQCGSKMIAELSQTTQLWSGPGNLLLQDRYRAAILVRMFHGRGVAVLEHVEAACLKGFVAAVLRIDVLNKRELIKMLPWYQRRLSRHKSSTSPV
ncbi:hypothetical protein KCU91_g7153, partial [Aureobasidium melanogenum]